MELEFFADPAAFLDAAGDHLAADPVLGTVIAGVSERTAREVADGIDSWTGGRARRSTGGGWSCATTPGRSSAPRCAPLRSSPIRSSACRCRTLPPASWQPPCTRGARSSAASTVRCPRRRRSPPGQRHWPGARSRSSHRTRALGSHRGAAVPPAPPGRLRQATADDAPQVLEWFTAFHVEADEQAGREPGPRPVASTTRWTACSAGSGRASNGSGSRRRARSCT